MIVLASASPRRREILEGLGLRVEVRTAGGEPEPLPGEDHRAYALRAARHKAAAVGNEDRRLVLAADTVVAIEGRLFGKPADEADARRMLEALSGKTHEVTTAFCLFLDGQEAHAETVTTRVVFDRLSRERIDRYVRSGEPLDKAGAYAIQGRGMALVRAIEGSYSNVVGLPAAELVSALERLGIGGTA